MQRILVTGAANIGKAGVATIVYKWGQQFNSEEIVYDYLMQRGLPEKKYQVAIKAKGGIIYTRKEGNKNLLGVIKWVEKIIKDNNYKVIHINSDTAFLAAAYIFAAKKANIEKIYVHSHCTKVDDYNKLRRWIKTILHYACRPYICKNTNAFLACSKLAGIWMFGKKNVDSDMYQLIYNGVNVDDYLYNQEVREEYRNVLDLKDYYVIGCIGRFSYQKNQSFLIDVFNEFQVSNPKSKLILIGDGELREELVLKVNQLGLESKVVLLGLRDDVPSLLSAIDILVMPSRFEGLPVTMVEAQMASLPCVVSNNITKEAKFTENVEYVEGYDVKNWAETICKFMSVQRSTEIEKKYMSEFNIKNAVIKLEYILKGERIK